MRPSYNSLAIALLGCSAAQTYAEDTKFIKSEVVPGASISYKEVHICETTPGVRSFSGYVNIPGSALNGFGGANNHNASLYFWYIESRKDPKNAPLSLYLGGGPGSTSLGGVTAENGPCHINADSNSTTLNAWSWNNRVNMVYVDSPAHVGFSYDEIVPGVLDLFTGTVSPNNGSAKSNATSFTGLFPTADPGNAVNTTMNVARSLWQFSQIWLKEFPEHKSSDDRFSIWANSYGGHYGPVTMEYFQSQNEKIAQGKLNNTCAKHINLDTIGLTNACLDIKIEGPFYPQYAYNNTYGLEIIPEKLYLESKNNITKQGGCFEQVDNCRALVAAYDPENTGANETVNAACATATLYCFQYVQGAYTAVSDRSVFDISREKHSIFPSNVIMGYLNQEWVRKELGVPVNFTVNSQDIQSTFFGLTGDLARTTVKTFDNLASKGVKIALIHGDRDYRCNWLGGEALSLAIDYPSTSLFHSAGYAPIATNESYSGGLVRQHSRLSFNRVFEAGHAVGAYQPETVSKIFDRVMFDKDVATGTVDTKKMGKRGYSSKGLANVFHVKNVLPPSPENVCYLWDVLASCFDEQVEMIRNGTAVVKDYVLVK